MEYIFEIKDKTSRRIYLTKERWRHVKRKHPEIVNVEEIEETVRNPDKITSSKLD